MPEDKPHDLSPTRHARPSDGWFFRFDAGAFQRVHLSAIAFVVIVAALAQARLIVVPTLLAILCAVALTPLTRRLERIGAPATLSAVVIVVTLLAGREARSTRSRRRRMRSPNVRRRSCARWSGGCAASPLS